MKGNESADDMARKALVKEKIEFQVSLSKAEVKSVVWERINQMWQERWDGESKGRHLYNVQKSVKVRRVGSGQRREEIVLTRLRLGHSGLNKTLKLMGKHESGLCEGCQEEETVEHVLMECREYETERNNMRDKLRDLGMGEFSLRGILAMNNRLYVKTLLGFLRDIGIYDRL